MRGDPRAIGISCAALLLCACTRAHIGTDSGAGLDAAADAGASDSGGPVDGAAAEDAAADASSPDAGDGSDAGPADADTCPAAQRCFPAMGAPASVSCLDTTATCLSSAGLRFDWCACGVPAVYFDPPPGQSRGAPLRQVILVAPSSYSLLSLQVGGICRGGEGSVGCEIRDAACPTSTFAWRWDVSSLRYTSEVGVSFARDSDPGCTTGIGFATATWTP